MDVEFNTNPFIIACNIYKSIWPCVVETAEKELFILFEKPVQCNAIKSLLNRLNNGKTLELNVTPISEFCLEIGN